MQTAVINIKTEPKVKKEAQKVAKDLGFSLSSVIDGYLRQLIRAKSINFRLDEIPNAYLKSVIKQAEKNLKDGKHSPAFKTGKEAVAWLEKQGI